MIRKRFINEWSFLLLINILIIPLKLCSPSSPTQRSNEPKVTLTLSSGNKSSSFECPEQFGYYDDLSDCSKYFVCVFGEALHETCTGGLYFSSELQTCDWPSNVNCALDAANGRNGNNNNNSNSGGIPGVNVNNKKKDTTSVTAGSLAIKPGGNNANNNKKQQSNNQKRIQVKVIKDEKRTTSSQVTSSPSSSSSSSPHSVSPSFSFTAKPSLSSSSTPSLSIHDRETKEDSNVKKEDKIFDDSDEEEEDDVNVEERKRLLGPNYDTRLMTNDGRSDKRGTIDGDHSEKVDEDKTEDDEYVLTVDDHYNSLQKTRKKDILRRISSSNSNSNNNIGSNNGTSNNSVNKAKEVEETIDLQRSRSQQQHFFQHAATRLRPPSDVALIGTPNKAESDEKSGNIISAESLNRFTASVGRSITGINIPSPLLVWNTHPNQNLLLNNNQPIVTEFNSSSNLRVSGLTPGGLRHGVNSGGTNIFLDGEDVDDEDVDGSDVHRKPHDSRSRSEVIEVSSLPNGRTSIERVILPIDSSIQDETDGENSSTGDSDSGNTEDSDTVGSDSTVVDKRRGGAMPSNVPYFQNQRLQQQQHFRRSIPIAPGVFVANTDNHHNNNPDFRSVFRAPIRGSGLGREITGKEIDEEEERLRRTRNGTDPKRQDFGAVISFNGYPQFDVPGNNNHPDVMSSIIREELPRNQLPVTPTGNTGRVRGRGRVAASTTSTRPSQPEIRNNRHRYLSTASNRPDIEDPRSFPTTPRFTQPPPMVSFPSHRETSQRPPSTVAIDDRERYINERINERERGRENRDRFRTVEPTSPTPPVNDNYWKLNQPQPVLRANNGQFGPPGSPVPGVTPSGIVSGSGRRPGIVRVVVNERVREIPLRPGSERGSESNRERNKEVEFSLSPREVVEATRERERQPPRELERERERIPPREERERSPPHATAPAIERPARPRYHGFEDRPVSPNNRPVNYVVGHSDNHRRVPENGERFPEPQNNPEDIRTDIIDRERLPRPAVRPSLISTAPPQSYTPPQRERWPENDRPSSQPQPPRQTRPVTSVTPSLPSTTLRDQTPPFNRELPRDGREPENIRSYSVDRDYPVTEPSLNGQTFPDFITEIRTRPPPLPQTPALRDNPNIQPVNREPSGRRTPKRIRVEIRKPTRAPELPPPPPPEQPQPSAPIERRPVNDFNGRDIQRGRESDREVVVRDREPVREREPPVRELERTRDAEANRVNSERQPVGARTSSSNPPPFLRINPHSPMEHGQPLGLLDYPLEEITNEAPVEPTRPSVTNDRSRDSSDFDRPSTPSRPRQRPPTASNDYDSSTTSKPKRLRPVKKIPSVKRIPKVPVTVAARPPLSYDYSPPPIGTTALKCDTNHCRLPDCNCANPKIPGKMPVKEVPQIVLLTFDDAVNDLNWELYEELFNSGRKNPNGCPLLGTFYVSHEWTDYSQVQTLYSRGHEMASHGVTHSFGEKFSKSQWMKEIHGQREILSLYGGVKMEDVRGMRAPFLQIGGNRMFEMLHEANFTYDSSMPVFDNNPPFWPYTLDFAVAHECMIGPCPTKSYPGVWEVGMTMWEDLRGGRCSMADACTNPNDEEGVYEMLMKNFNRHYKSNRAPFGIYYHSAWFTKEHHRKGFMRFLDEILTNPDVFFTTNWQMIQWMRNPTPMSQIDNFEPWDCMKPDPERPGPCHNPAVCNVNHKDGTRFLKTCQPCPRSYPWLGKTGWSELRGDQR